MFAKQICMYNYRKILYENYYSTHSGKVDEKIRFQHFDQQRRYFIREFQPYMSGPKDMAILDIGCGTGSLIKALNDMGYSNTQGIDLSKEQVEMSRKFGVEGIEQQDAKTFLEKNQGKYDCIFAVDLIEHLGKDELVDFLQLVRASLKEGGSVIFRTPNMDAPLASVFAFADFTHEVFLNKSSALQLMQANGFKNVQVEGGIVYIENPVKEIFRKIGWACTLVCLKLQLFFSARTWDKVVFTPNIVIIGKK